MKMKTNIIGMMVALVLMSCGSDKSTEKNQVAAVQVKTMNLEAASNGSDYRASGTLSAVNQSQVSTRMMGYVVNVHVKIGQKVPAGALLVTLDQSDLSAKKAQADAGVMQAEAAFANARADYNRFQTLFQQQSATAKELEDMTTRYEMAKAGLEAAKQMRNEVQAQFAYAQIRAPFAGTVSQTFVKAGDMANPGMPLVSIEGGSTLEVKVRVTERQISQIQNGTKVQVFLKNKGKKVPGTVIETSASAQYSGGQYPVVVRLDEIPADVLPGMYVSVEFPNAKTDKNTMGAETIRIPSEAVITKGDLKGVYVVSQQKTAVLRWIRLGRQVGSEVEVLSGLQQGETLIVSADGKLFNGAVVAF
jgi:RND family efflux transporter MFP subunit